MTSDDDAADSSNVVSIKGARPRGRCDELRVNAAQSFTPHEVAVLEQLLKIVVRGGDTRVIARTQPEAIAALRRKAAAMTAQVERRAAQRAAILAADPLRTRG